MDNVQFKEENSFQRPDLSGRRPGGIIGLVMKFGLAKNQKDAELVLIVIFVLVLIATFFMLYQWRAGEASRMPPPLPVSVPR